MATSSEVPSGSDCVKVIDTETEQHQPEQTLKLCLKKKKKKINWTKDTVDNEGLGKKKSKCCCQYTKPRNNLNESSSDSEDDCGNCFGH